MQFMIEMLENEFNSDVSQFTSSASVFAHIDGNRCCRTLNVKLVKDDQYETRIFTFHRFENFKPMFESLPISSNTEDHDHLQIYWDRKKAANVLYAIMISYRGIP